MIQTDKINPASFRNFGMAILTQPFSFDLLDWVLFKLGNLRTSTSDEADCEPGSRFPSRLTAVGYSTNAAIW
jgi:hypothetical protein